MRTKTKRSPSPKHVLVITGVVVVIVASYIFLAHSQGWWPSTQKPNSKVDGNNVQNTTTNASPKNNNVVAKSDETAKTNQTSNQTTDQVPTNTDASATIVQLEQVSGNVLIVARVENTTTGGMCVVTFTNPNDRPITKEFSPSEKDGSISCSTSIPAYEFSFLGTWHATLRYYQGSKQVTAEGDVKIS